MGVFDYSKMDDVGINRTGRYILPGTYLVRVRRCSEKKSERNKRNTFFIGELDIVESDNDQRGPGSKMSHAINMNGAYPDLALSNVKAFLYACACSLADASGDDRPTEEEITGEVAKLAVSGDNPFVGVFLKLTAWNRPTKDGDGEFTVTEWEVPENVGSLAA